MTSLDWDLPKIKSEIGKQRKSQPNKIEAHLDRADILNWKFPKKGLNSISFMRLLKYLKEDCQVDDVYLYLPSSEMSVRAIDQVKEYLKRRGLYLSTYDQMSSETFVETINYLLESDLLRDMLNIDIIKIRILIKALYPELSIKDKNTVFEMSGFNLITKTARIASPFDNPDILDGQIKNLIAEEKRNMKREKLEVSEKVISRNVISNLRQKYTHLVSCNLDNEIIEVAENIQDAVAQVFFSGDGDFGSLYQDLNKRGQQVYVVHPNNYALSSIVRKLETKRKLKIVYPEKTRKIWV